MEFNLLKNAAKVTIENGGGSLSLLQRRFHLGYNSAYRLMEKLKEIGVVGENNGANPRELLITDFDSIDFDSIA